MYNAGGLQTPAEIIKEVVYLHAIIMKKGLCRQCPCLAQSLHCGRSSLHPQSIKHILSHFPSLPITDIQFLTFSYFYIRHLLFIIFHIFLILNIFHLYARDFLFLVSPQFSSYPFKYMPPIMFLSGFFFCLSVSHSLSIAVCYGQFVLVLIFYFYQLS